MPRGIRRDDSDKTCRDCNATKSIGEFYETAYTRKDGTRTRSARCKACERSWQTDYNRRNRSVLKIKDAERYQRNRAARRAQAKEYRQRNPAALSEANRRWREANPTVMRRNMLRRKYGIEPAEYDRMLARQGGLCAICHQPERTIDSRSGLTWPLAVDHDHHTGELRGLLCRACNQGIGMFQDDPALLSGAAAYLSARVNVNLSAALTSGKVRVVACGTEE